MYIVQNQNFELYQDALKFSIISEFNHIIENNNWATYEECFRALNYIRIKSKTIDAMDTRSIEHIRTWIQQLSVSDLEEIYTQLQKFEICQNQIQYPTHLPGSKTKAAR